MPLNRWRTASGFTLIEILVVVILVGVVAGIAVISIGSGGQQLRELRSEAERLHAVLRTTVDEAIVQNTEFGFRLEDNAYEFLAFDELELDWVEPTETFMVPHQMPEWVVVEFDQQNKQVEFTSRDDNRRDEPRKLPQMVFFSSGEHTPFEIKLTIEAEEDRVFMIRSDGLNTVELRYPETPDDDEFL